MIKLRSSRSRSFRSSPYSRGFNDDAAPEMLGDGGPDPNPPRPRIECRRELRRFVEGFSSNNKLQVSILTLPTDFQNALDATLDAMTANASHTGTDAIKISTVQIEVMRNIVGNPLNLGVSPILTVFIAKVDSASTNTSNAMAFRIAGTEVMKPIILVRTATCKTGKILMMMKYKASPA